MKNEQFHNLLFVETIKRMINADDLQDKSDRTLIYGYTCERSTFHTYLKNGEITVLIYSYNADKPEIVTVTSNNDYVPDKRLYPARCDFEFCKLLKENGIHYTFTTWEDYPEEKQFYGKILEDWNN